MDISIVTGYKAKKIKFKDVNFYNKEFKSTNMVYSLMKAKNLMMTHQQFIQILLYQKILKNDKQKYDRKLAVAVDTQWKKYWAFRFKDINQDLESLKINSKIRLLNLEEN